MSIPRGLAGGAAAALIVLLAAPAPSASSERSAPPGTGRSASADTASAHFEAQRPARGLAQRYRPLLVPVAGVRRADLIDTYRQARSEGRRHRAIDIHAPAGTPVLAAADGTVVKLFESVPGGTTLYQLDLDERTIYYYAHLDGYAEGIAEGRRVARGDTIGFVGDSGNAQPGDHHLHFAVTSTRDPARWWGGRPTNPYPLLRDASDLP